MIDEYTVLTIGVFLEILMEKNSEKEILNLLKRKNLVKVLKYLRDKHEI